MKPTKTALDLHEFFPVALEIYDIVSDENQITIYMKSKSKECICPACGTISQKTSRNVSSPCARFIDFWEVCLARYHCL